MIDENNKLLSADQMARAIIRDSAAISLSNDRMKILDTNKGADFTALCHELIEDRSASKMRAMRLPCRGRSELLLLLCHVHTQRDYGSPSRDSLTIFVSDSETNSFTPSADLIAELFGMTRAEAAVTALLVKGNSISQVADQLHLSENTVRSYLKPIFCKTGVKRQADLVRVIANSVAVLSGNSLGAKGL